jgi:outer membrane protein TolC
LHIRFPILAALIALGCASRAEPPLWPADAPLPSTPTDAHPGAPSPSVALPAEPTLSDLLEIALVRNPRIRAARERALAQTHTARIDSGLPDPKLLLGWYESPVETRVGPMEYSLSIRQDIPWPGKLSAQADLGATTARRQSLLYEIVVRDVIAEVVRSAHELAYFDEAIDISASIAPLLERYAAAASGTTTPLPELYRAETQRVQLDNDRIVLAELRAAESERLAALLDLPADAIVGTPRPPEPPALGVGYREMLETARAHNQELSAAGIAVEAAALRTRLAERERLPDLSVGYSHIFVGDGGSGLAESGQDARIFHLGLTLPLWVGKDSARVQRAKALERAAMQDRRDAEASIRTDLSRTWFEIGNSRRLWRLYRDVLIPRAEAAARSAEDLQRSGKGTLAGSLETIAALHNFRLAAARARADYGRALAKVETILGRPLESDRPEGEDR